MKKKYYVVWNGVMPGIYESWSECQAQIKGYVGALYKSFGSRQEAEQAMCRPAYSYIGKKSKQKTGDRVKGSYIKKSIAVDAACSGNPGVLEYRGVNVETGELIFHVGTFPQGTNNIGEFLALVHALAMLKQAGSSLPVYSDSHNAIVWVKKKKCGTKLARTAINEQLFNLVDRAERWLALNDYASPILKWETSAWGEIPADFGRK